MSDNDRINDLESRIAFQEDALDKLSDVVAHQELELEKLTRMIRLLNEKIQQVSLGESNSGADVPPPHY